MKALDLITQPWAVREDVFRAIAAAALGSDTVADAKRAACVPEPEGSDERRARFGFDRSASESELEVFEGVAVIPIRGALTQESYWRGDRASYDWIGARLEEALEADSVRAILFEVDSPGGQVKGTEDLSRRIFEARSVKPISAVTLGQASSAAFWLASSALGVFSSDRTSLHGSIGVVWTFLDFSKMDERIGIQEIDVVSSQSPDKRLDPTTKRGLARVQATVDRLAGVFVGDVARNRAVAEETVLADYGRGWVLLPDEALSVGMIDGIRSSSDQVGELAKGNGGGRGSRATQGDPMKTIELAAITVEWLAENLPDVAQALRDAGALVASQKPPSEEALAGLDAVVSEAMQAGHAEGATAERERIMGIAAAGEGLAQDELVAEMQADSTVTLEAASIRLLEAGKARRKGELDARGEDETDVDVDAGRPGDPDSNSRVDLVKKQAKAAGLAAD